METLTLTVTIIKLCGKPARPCDSCPQGAPQDPQEAPLGPGGGWGCANLAGSQGQLEDWDELSPRAGSPAASASG